MGTKNSGVMPNFDCIIKVGTSPETAEPIGDKVDFLKEKMPEVPTELRDCSRELEYIEDMIEENEAEHDRLEERRDELEVIQAKYEELQEIKREIEEYNKASIRLLNDRLINLYIETLAKAGRKEIARLEKRRDELEGRWSFTIKACAKRLEVPKEKAIEIFKKVADESNRAKFIINRDAPAENVNKVPPLVAQGSEIKDYEFILNEERLAKIVMDNLHKGGEEIRDDLLNHQTIPISEKEEYREELKEALSAVNLIQDALDPSLFSDGCLTRISNFLQDARDYIVDTLDELEDKVNSDD